MPQILPFKGMLYNPNKIKNILSSVAPPYDVISPSLQEELYKKSPYNISRLTLPQGNSQDKYMVTKDILSQWQKDRILIQDKEPAIYVYEQEFNYKGEKKVLSGFIAICKLEDLKTGCIKPHEQTFPKPKEDRLKLLRACETDLEPIYCLYSNNAVTNLISSAKKELMFDFMYDGRHKFLRITDSKIHQKIHTALDRIYIADGHHRYETALTYSKEMHAKYGDGAYNYIMMYLVDMNGDSVIILPTHRVIPRLNIDSQKFLDSLEELFILEEINNQDGLIENLERNKEHHAMGVALNNRYYAIIPKNENVIIEYGDKSKPLEWNSLDVAILDNLVIKHILGMTDYTDEDIKYTKNESEAIKFAGDKGVAFILNPTAIQDVRLLAEAGILLPRKSTHFWPKPLSGLAIFPKH